MRHTTAIIVAAILSAASICAAADEPAIELAPRYTDNRHGFSLCPPAGTERAREISPVRLVTWRNRDEKTKAIVWTLTVMRAIESKKQIDLNAYAKELAADLRAKENFQVETAEVIKLAGKDAIDLSGMTVGQFRVWMRQTWVEAEPGRFIIVKLTGPAGMKDELNAICKSVLPTLEIIDPKVAQVQREENLARGRALLASLTDDKLAAVIRTQPQWVLFRNKNGYFAFSKMVESRAERNGGKGSMVKEWLWVGLAEPPTVIKQVMFATADRRSEHWSYSVFKGVGGRLVLSRTMERDKDDGFIIRMSSVAPGRKPSVRKTKIPPGNVPVYLPQAMFGLIERLVDLSKPDAYAFAIYNVEANGFDMRTFTVVGPEKIEVDGRKVDAIRCTDRHAEDKDVLTVWLDAKGLRIQAGNETTTIMAVTRDELLKHFPKAESIVAQMGD